MRYYESPEILVGEAGRDFLSFDCGNQGRVKVANQVSEVSWFVSLLVTGLIFDMRLRYCAYCPKPRKTRGRTNLNLKT